MSSCGAEGVGDVDYPESISALSNKVIQRIYSSRNDTATGAARGGLA